MGLSILFSNGCDMYTGGTAEAVRLLEKYKKAGYIVDFYSDDYIRSLDEDSAPITVEDLKAYDEKHGTRYRGHMLAVYLGDENKELLDELGSVYRPFYMLFNLEGAFGGWAHKPDLLLINLATQEILCVGLGRKNRPFSFELHRYLTLGTTNDESNKILRDVDSEISTDCSEKFIELDHFRVAKQVIDTSAELGRNYFEYDNLPGNADVLVSLNEEDGLFYWDDFEDEDGMTEEEVTEIRTQYENYREWIDDCIRTLKDFFPKIDDWDMNTGDY